MVELITTDDVVYLTDSAGRVALHEPELSAETVFFKVKSPGYQAPKDGFGIEGVRLVLEPGVVHTVELKRTNFAERLYRITGRDIYLDTVRLGYSAPIAQPLLAGKVTGQDSIQSVTYRDELHWFWGDTNQLQYPLGLFRKTDDGVDCFYFGNPFPVTRVPATLAGIQDRNAYESWTCREELSEEYFTESQLSAAKPRRDSSGQLVWAWRKAPPVTQQDELRWLKQGLIQIEEARYLPRDVDADGTSLRSK